MTPDNKLGLSCRQGSVGEKVMPGTEANSPVYPTAAYRLGAVDGCSALPFIHHTVGMLAKIKNIDISHNANT